MRWFSDRLSVLVPSPYAYQKALSLVPAPLKTRGGSEIRGSAIMVRIPTKPAMHSNLKPATYTDLKPATVPI